MLMILSPAKTFKEEGISYALLSENLPFEQKTKELVTLLQAYSIDELAQLMKMSTSLSDVNVKRFSGFYEKKEQALLGIHAFEGEAYKGLDSLSLSEEALQVATQNLIILSGLYGAIHPFDRINPYRLEMGTKLVTTYGKDLYAFWRSVLTPYLIEKIGNSYGEKVLLNLASSEYSKVLDLKQIKQTYPVITIEFKEQKEAGFKVVGMYAKRARGMMARYLLQHQIKNIADLKAFNEDGYCFNPDLSDVSKWVFTRLSC